MTRNIVIRNSLYSTTSQNEWNLDLISSLVRNRRGIAEALCAALTMSEGVLAAVSQAFATITVIVLVIVAKD